MKNIIAGLALMVASFNVFAYQLWTPAGTVDTQMSVDSKGAFVLKQDMINNVNSSQPNRIFGYVAGHNPLVQNVRCDLWEGPTCIYVFPNAPMQMALSSSSANDSLSGTGAQKVMIHYLDHNYNAQKETVSLNGITPVNTVATDILRINSIHVVQTGTDGTSAGNISLKNVGGSVTYGYVAAGYNASRQAIYTVPAGYYGYISHWQAGSGTASGSHFTVISLRSTSHEGSLIGNFNLVDEIATLNSGQEISLPIPIRIPPTADVKISAISDASNANANAMGAIMGWFEKQ